MTSRPRSVPAVHAEHHTSARRHRRALVITLLVVNVVLWSTTTAALLFFAGIASAPFFGERPTSSELAESHRLLTWAVVVALLLPLVGLVCGALVRNRLAVRMSAIMLLLGVAITAAVLLRHG